MQKHFFYTLLCIVFVTVMVSLGAYIYNISTSPHEEIVLVKFLLSGTVISVITLMLEVARRWFLTSKFTKGTNEILLDIIGTSVVMNATESNQVDHNFNMLKDFYEEEILGIGSSDEAFEEELKAQIIKRVSKYKKLKFNESTVSESLSTVKRRP